MRPPLLAGLIGALLLSTPALAFQRESPWSASILGGPVAVYTPDDGDFDDFHDEFALRAGFSRSVTGPWSAGLEAGYTRFGFVYDAFGGEGGPPNIAPDGEYLDSFDASLSAWWHPRLRTLHPYVIVGAGAHAVHGYFPDANGLELSRQIRPGSHAAVGLHGLIRPALGLEVRWLTIRDGGGRARGTLYATDRNADVLKFLFSLTLE